MVKKREKSAGMIELGLGWPDGEMVLITEREMPGEGSGSGRAPGVGRSEGEEGLELGMFTLRSLR